MSPISSKELTERLVNNEYVNLVDVREALEFSTYNIGGKNIPLSRFAKAIEELTANKNEEIVVICKIGARSETACKLLIAQGFKNVRNLNGGLLALQKLKY